MGSRATQGLSVCTPARYAGILCTRLRCYMRLALEPESKDPNLPEEREVMTYNHHVNLWNAPKDQKTNPWALQLNDIMFYL